jgi:indole-3-glycerol phosphate synthase
MDWETAFYAVLGILNASMAGLLAYLAKTNIDLQKAVTGLSTTISGIVDRDLMQTSKRLHNIEGRLTQVEHDMIKCGASGTGKKDFC